MTRFGSNTLRSSIRLFFRNLIHQEIILRRYKKELMKNLSGIKIRKLNHKQLSKAKSLENMLKDSHLVKYSISRLSICKLELKNLIVIQLIANSRHKTNQSQCFRNTQQTTLSTQKKLTE